MQRFVLNEQEYDEEYPDNNSEDEKEIDFDFCKNDVDKDYSKIEEKIQNLKNADNNLKVGDEKKILLKKIMILLIIMIIKKQKMKTIIN
jgi:hypothetical protein